MNASPLQECAGLLKPRFAAWQPAAVGPTLAVQPARSSHAERRPRVVIVGAGFGGLEAAKALRRAPADVTVVDRQNHHCFQPLLYQVATAALSPADVAWPIRHILRGQDNVTVLMEEVSGVDLAAKAAAHRFRRDRLTIIW